MPSYLCDSSQTSLQDIDWSEECNSIGSMNISHRFVRTNSLQRPGLAMDSVACVAEVPSWTVNLECKVAADTRRVFDALTVPEYIETWICVPGHPPDCSNMTSRVANGFQIDHRCSSGSSMTIVGTYCSFLKRKLSFSWRSGAGPESLDSFVDIRLQGDFERSILRLRHFGLESEAEYNWHSALWTASIARLCKLFEKSTLGNGRRRQLSAY